jgi:tetratricopeptide (TPR) repeat protein
MPKGFPDRIRLLMLAGSCLVLFGSAAQGEDTVTFFSAGNRQARSRITGEIVDYTGKQIVIRLSDGREIKRPGQLVAEIETTWPAAKTQGDRLFEEHQFSAARDKYSAAIRAETRPWARRAMLARIIACYRELNQLEAAGKLFLALVREDPETPYFDEIPLAWQPSELPAAQAQTATQWLADESPAAGLIGASYLLSSLERQQALERLARLALDKDARIASLAEAQAWRASIATAKADQLAHWERRVESFPDASRAGAYWVLGRALAQHGEAQRALLAYLHVPIVYPQARPLAADALRAAAALLEKQGDTSAASRLRHELVDVYPETAAAAEVKSTLDSTAPRTSRPNMPAETGSIEQTFLAGLRARRLFTLAEERCRQRLGETGLSEAARVDLAVELSRTLAEHALYEGQAEREQLWKAAIDAVQASGLESIKGSRRLLLDVQQGLVRLTRGELARQEAELAGSNAAALEAARQELRAAIGLLQATVKEVARELRQASPSRRADACDLNANELAALERNLAYQLARAFRNQGESYPPKSADRTNSLRQAVEQLQALVADSDPVAWQARLDEVVCLRLLEDFEAAAAKIGKINDADPPAALAPAVKAEQIRLLLDQHRLDAALAAVEQVQALGVDVTADLDYAFLEVFLAAWRAAAHGDRPNDATQWQNRAAELISQIDERFGRYWSRRAEMLLAGSVTRSGGTQNLAVLARAAESFYRSGQFDQSLEAYDRAARQAREEKQGLAFDYAYTAAAIEQQRGRHASAAKRFRAAALDDSLNAKAPDAHLLAIYNLALAAKDGAEKAPDTPAATGQSKQEYLELLEEHLDHWPRSHTSSQARIWLGGFYERLGKYAEAIDAYKAVPVGDQQGVLAIEAVARCYQRWLATLAAEEKPTRDVAAKGAAYFERLVTGSRESLPERWSQAQRLAATSAAAIWLEYSDGEFARAEGFLSAALADSSDAPDAWKSAAQTLQIYALAAQGRRDEAAELLNQLSGDAPEQMLVLIEGLQRSAEKGQPKVKQELAELQLRAAKRLQDRVADLPADDRRKFQRAYVNALAAAGRHDEALAAAKGLADKFPRDGEIQEEYARLLVDSNDREALEKAAAKWRDIGQKTRQGSDRWLRSMYYQAVAARRLEKRDQVLRLVKFTESLVPELGGPEMKAKFHELLDDRPAKK